MSDKPRCFFHAGTAKTGTSAIQFAFTEHQEALRRRGYHYPDLARKFERARAGLPTTGNAAALLRMIKDGAVEDALELLKPYRGENLVLSHEAFANLARADAAGVLKFVDGLRSLGFEPSALVMFRPQSEFIPSFYLQQVKADNTALDLEEYLAGDTSPARLQSRYNWLSYAQPMEAAFGAGLKVLWYPAVQRGEGVTAAAFRWLGLEPMPTQKVVVNPSPGLEPLAVLREANEAGTGGRRLADPFLIEAEKRGWLGHKLVLSEAHVRRIEQATRQTNEELLRRYCPDLSIDAELAPGKVVPAQCDESLIARLRELASEIARDLKPAARRARSA